MTYVDAAVTPLRKTGQIKIYGPTAFAGMRRAGRLGGRVLDLLVPEVAPGAATDHIDRLVYEFGMDHHATPATLTYRGYRHTLCTSINHVVCHGIPNDKPLREGDIVNIDVTRHPRWLARQYEPHVSGRRCEAEGAERLVDITYEAMMRGIAVVKPGATTGDIGHAIQTFAEAQERCTVVRDFCGHGLGRLFHDVAQYRALSAVPGKASSEARHVFHGRADDRSRPATV